MLLPVNNIMKINLVYLFMFELAEKGENSATHVEGVDFVTRSRYASGRKIEMPYFRVKLCPDLRKENNSEYAFISIAKWGWSKAWKKALTTLTVKKNREKVVRFMSRPPKKENYGEICTRV